MFQCLIFFLLKYDIPTHVGTLEEEVKDEIMETGVKEFDDFVFANKVMQKLRNNSQS